MKGWNGKEGENQTFPGSLTFFLHQALNRQVVLAEVLNQLESAPGPQVKLK